MFQLGQWTFQNELHKIQKKIIDLYIYILDFSINSKKKPQKNHYLAKKCFKKLAKNVKIQRYFPKLLF